jgi:hypothetical protein
MVYRRPIYKILLTVYLYEAALFINQQKEIYKRLEKFIQSITQI